MQALRPALIVAAMTGLVLGCGRPLSDAPAAPAESAADGLGGDLAATPSATIASPSALDPTPTQTPDDATIAGELVDAAFDRSQWRTDFSRRAVPFSEIFSGGVPKDGIPAIDKPKLVSIENADGWLKANEPVVAYQNQGDARAYPLQILVWHEIVNDTVGGMPVVVTYCPLCNTAIVFDAQVDGRSLTFGTTGNLRFSDLVMYDRQTESWWQQITGEAIIGEMSGRNLEYLPATMVSWRDFKQAYPRGQVLSKDTGYQRNYGVNPYSGYDTARSPFLYTGPTDDRLQMMERVVGVVIGDDAVAFPFSQLEKGPVVQTAVGGREIVILFQRGTASALDAGSIAEGRDVGATGVFLPEIDGQRLTFEPGIDGFEDRQTGTTWNIFGQAVAGALEGRRLTPVVHANHFWFAWAVFQPDTRVVPAG